MIIKINENINQILGCLMLSPNLLNKDCSLIVEDFPNSEHKIIFSCIYNMNKTGIKSSIAPSQILSYMKEFNLNWYNIYTSIGVSADYLDNILTMAKLEDFDYNVGRLKKNSLLVELHSGGFDISRLYDITGSSQELNLNFEVNSIDDILSSLFKFNNQLKKKWCTTLDDTGEMLRSNQGVRDLIETFKKGQTFGIKFSNKVLNSIAKGAQTGKVILFGASSGVGKTRTSVLNACDMAIPFKLDPATNSWKSNGQYENVLFITTELLLDEIQSMMLACISNINENKIKYEFESLNEHEQTNLEKSLHLMENFPIHVCHLPNYDLQDLEIIVEEYVLKHNIRYIFFDYIHLTGKIMEQLKGIREDIIILQIMTALKNIANKYECFIWVGSQLNRNATDSNNKDSFAVFRSALSIGDKVDLAIATMKATSKEIEDICKSLELIQDFTTIKKPNLVNTVIKNRGGQNSIRIWTHFNHGTLEEEVVAVTDLENNLISVEIFDQELEPFNGCDEWLRWLNG